MLRKGNEISASPTNKSYRWDGDTLKLALHVQPRASQNKFAGQFGERLKIQITAPATDNQANEKLIDFLAKHFGVSRSHVIIEHGSGSRDKLVAITAPKKNTENFAKNPRN